MYIATNELCRGKSAVVGIFPQSIRRYMMGINLDEAQEIRMICGYPIYIHYPDGDYYITQKGVLCRKSNSCIRAGRRQIEELVEKASKSSLYSVKDRLKNGYITIDGGHRIGIAGTAVTNSGEVDFIKNISAVNIRIANEIIGIADKVMGDMEEDGRILNTLIISPPGCGKTTLLRDIARCISYMGYSVCIADERSEIAAMNDGMSAFDLGPKTVVFEGCKKAHAMTSLLRTMSPSVILTDELGDKDDVKAVYDVINCGVGVIASAHGRNAEDIMKREVFRELVPLFDRFIILSSRNGAGTVEKIVGRGTDA